MRGYVESSLPRGVKARAALFLAILGAAGFSLTRLWSVALGPAGDGAGVIWFSPPLTLQLAAGLAAAALVVICWRGCEWRLKKQGQDPLPARDQAALILWPISVLGLVPLVELCAPLYQISLAPLALAREGWPLALAAVVLSLAIQVRLMLVDNAGAALPESARSRPWLPWLVFIIALTAFILFGARLHQVSRQEGQFMGGDEPQYMFNAHSIAVDHDLDLVNNILLRESMNFMDPAWVLGGHSRWSLDKRYISKHRPGLPILMSPFYAWGLYSGVGVRKASVVLIWLLAAWMAAEVFLVCRNLTKRDLPSFAAAMASALFLPGLHYSNLLFPEMAAATFGIAAFRRIHQAGEEAQASWRQWLLAGILTAYLAWFHERFILLSVILGGYALWQGVWRSRISLAAFFTPCLISAGLIMNYFMKLYGRPFPTSSIHAQGSYLNPRGAWEGLSGLFWDAGEGLFPYAAIWLAAIAGLIWLVRKNRCAGIWAACMAIATYITAGLYADWFGGINPPCRYLVAAIPFLAVGLGAGIHLGPPRFRLVSMVLALAATASAVYVIIFPSGVYGHEIKLGNFFQFPILENLLPTYIVGKTPAQNSLIAAVWTGFGVLVLLLLQTGSRKSAPGKEALFLAVVFLLAFLAGAFAESAGPGVLEGRGWRHILREWQRESSHGPHRLTWQATRQAPNRDLHINPVNFRHGAVKALGNPPSAVARPAGGKPELFIWGQYITLPPGRYKVVVELESSLEDQTVVADLDAAADLGRKVFGKILITGEMAQKPVSLEFASGSVINKVEFRLGTSAKADLVVKNIWLKRL
jgi:hypothetical protein